MSVSRRRAHFTHHLRGRAARRAGWGTGTRGMRAKHCSNAGQPDALRSGLHAWECASARVAMYIPYDSLSARRRRPSGQTTTTVPRPSSHPEKPQIARTRRPRCPTGGVDMNYSNERRASVRAAALDVILKLIGPSSSGSVCGRAVRLLEHTHPCTCTHYNNCPGRAECSTTATATPTTVWLL